jgi:hypothetical protein
MVMYFEVMKRGVVYLGKLMYCGVTLRGVL